MASLVIVGKGVLSISFASHELQTAAATTTWTFTKSIGSVPSDQRYVVVLTYSPTPSDTTSSVTVDGSAASAVSGITGNKMYLINKNAGTNATIVATNSAARDSFAVGVYAIYGDLNTTPFATLNTGGVGTTASGSLNVPDGGVAVGWAQDNSTAPAATLTWTSGLTKDFQDSAVSGGAAAESGASTGTFSGNSTLTVTVSASGSGGSDSTLLRSASFATN